MLVGFDLYTLQEPSESRGIGRFSRDLVNAMHAADPGMDALYYCVAGRSLFGRPHGPAGKVRLLSLLPDDPPAFNRSEALDRHFAAGNPDGIDCLLSLSPLQSLVQAHAGCPRRVAIHYDLIPEVFPEVHMPSEDTQALYRQRIDTLKTYDAVLTLSEHAKDDLIARHDFDPDLITAIGAGIAPVFRAAANDAERAVDRYEVQHLGIAPGQPFILNVGGTDPRKGAHRLVEAFALLPDTLRQDMRLVFAFDTSPLYRQDLIRHADRLGIDSHAILCTGWVPDNVLAALYRRANLMVFPSLYEGFGLPILEAMACGAPVVLGDNSSQPEVACGSALAVDAMDPTAIAAGITRVLTEDGLAERMSRQGLVAARRYSWEKTAALVLEACRPPHRV